MNKLKLLIVIGTRPEAIKMAPLINRLTKENKEFDTKICVTAQHRDMLDQVLDFFEITPDFDLNLMTTNQNLYTITSDIILNLKPILDKFSPDYVLVHGDTTTCMAASLAAFYSNSKVCHIEAGLRTFNKLSPFPEEMNRQITSRIADIHFAPTVSSKNNLINENIPEEKIIITGNTVIDALFQSLDKTEKLVTSNFVNEMLTKLNNNEVILVTGHRRENHGVGFKNICDAIKEIAIKKPNIRIVYPVHPNPNIQEPINRFLENIENVLLIPPLDYPDFIWLMNRAKLILTDSGGVQEEAPSLGKPVLVMRETSERPEAIEAGTVILVGTDKDKIVNETISLIEDSKRYNEMSVINNPYGDGFAVERIIKYFKSVKDNSEN